MRSQTLLATSLALAAFVPCARAERVVQGLYDAIQFTLPDKQGWTFFALPAVTPTLDPLAVLDTTADNLVRGGWSRVLSPAVSAAEGFQVDFELELVAESHASTNRAGFSVIALDHSRRGIELGFWADHVWAQSDSPLFTHAEDAAFVTQGRIVQYSLQVLGDRYELAAGGTRILSGPLRDYTAFSGNFDVYETPDFLFFGDDTTSAAAKTRLLRVSVTRDLTSRPPSLSATPVGPVLHLRWPAGSAAVSWVLESAPDPVKGPWERSASRQFFEPGLGGGSFFTEVDSTLGARYYRLR